MRLYKPLIYKSFSLIFVLLLCNGFAFSQDNSNKGTDFWLGFMDHIEGNDANMYLYITSDTNATGTVSIPGQSWSTTYSVTKNSMTLVTVPTDKSRVACSDCTESKGIHVTSDLPVVVYSHVYETYKSDATLVLPTATAGKEYYCMSYTQVQQRNDPNESSQFMVVASQDNTLVQITPSCDILKGTGVHTAGNTYTITLDEGEVYQGKGRLNGSYAGADVSGTFIQVIDTGKNSNCRTVSVFSGSSNSLIGCTSSRASSDILFEQMFPVSSLGNKFIAVPSKDKTSDIIRVMAVENGTVVRIGSTNYSLAAGKFVELTISGNQTLYIRAPKPIMVAQFHTSQLRCGGGYGDPAMIMLTPIEQTLEDIVVYSASRQNITKNFINVVIPTSGISSFRLDGSAVTFTTVASYGAYSYAQLAVSSGNHRLTADVGFNAIAYGFGNYESYGYAAGANIKNRSVYIDLANSNYEKDLGVCLGEQVSFQGKVSNQTIIKWEWDFGDGITDTVQNPKHDYNKPGVYSVVVKAHKKNSNGCSTFDSSVLELAIYATPKADFAYTALCKGDAVLFTDSTKIDSGYEIQANIWNLGVGTAKFGTHLSNTYVDTGWYTITNQAVSKNNCRNTATKKIYINPKPEVKFGYENLCSGQNTNFIDSSKIDRGDIVKWNWKFNINSDSSDLQNPSYTFPSFGSNAVKLTAESDSGCISSWDTTLTILDSIKANFEVRDTCINKSFSFTNTSHEGSSALTYSWDFGDDSTSTVKSPSHNYLNAKNHTVTLIASQDDKCYDTLIKSITVFPLTTGKILYSDACFNDLTNIYNTYNLSNGTVSSFEWKINGSVESTDSSFTKTFANPGKNNITLKYITSHGCESSISDSIIINPPPVAKIWTNNIDQLCFGESLRLVDSSSTNDSIQYSEFKFLTNKTTNKEYNYTTDSTGMRTFYLKVTSKYGCSDSTSKVITVNPGPVPDFLSAESCVNESQGLLNLTTLDVGTIVQWRWTENGTLLSTVKDPTISFNSSGTKAIQLYAESNNGCKDSIIRTLNVNDNPIASFDFDTVCFGSSTSLTSTSTTPTGTIDVYNWTYGDSRSGTGMNSSNIYAAPGNYKVELIVTTDKNCKDTIDHSIIVGDIPNAEFSADNLIGCIPQEVNFTDLSSITNGNITEWEWDFGNTGSSTSQNPFTIYNTAGVYNISLKVTSEFGCIHSTTKNSHIEIFNLPTADFSMNPDTPTFLNPDVQFNDLSIGNGILAWDWEFGNGDVASDQNPFYSFTDTGLYAISLKVTDVNGCSDTITQSIFLTPILKFYMPNAFYPNDNIRNDIFKPGGVFQGINDYTIKIYNRWGELMFQSSDPSEGWDGSFGGKPCPMGAYIYSVRYTDYTRSKWFDLSGDFTLFK